MSNKLHSSSGFATLFNRKTRQSTRRTVCKIRLNTERLNTVQ